MQRSGQKASKILVFEYFTAGGLLETPVTEELLAEALALLNALLDALRSLKGCELIVLIDSKLNELQLDDGINWQYVSDQADFYTVLQRELKQVDYVWPIAPETAVILEHISRAVENAGKILLNSNSQAVALCANKLQCSQYLREMDIQTVDSYPFNDFIPDFSQRWVVKPVDGIACEHTQRIDTLKQYQAFRQTVQTENFIIQPYMDGQAMSLSCLFKEGQAWLLSCNQQHIVLNDRQFSLKGCSVNFLFDREDHFQGLINQLAEAIPGLWGYVGIDFIYLNQQVYLLEINPRLTTSFIGIQRALGINPAEQVLQLLCSEPTLQHSIKQTINVTI